MFITQRYTLYHASTMFRRIYWARELLEKWGNHKRDSCAGKVVEYRV